LRIRSYVTVYIFLYMSIVSLRSFDPACCYSPPPFHFYHFPLSLISSSRLWDMVMASKLLLLLAASCTASVLSLPRDGPKTWVTFPISHERQVRTITRRDQDVPLFNVTAVSYLIERKDPLSAYVSHIGWALQMGYSYLALKFANLRATQ
jgi:hypothetical protein